MCGSIFGRARFGLTAAVLLTSVLAVNVFSQEADARVVFRVEAPDAAAITASLTPANGAACYGETASVSHRTSGRDTLKAYFSPGGGVSVLRAWQKRGAPAMINNGRGGVSLSLPAQQYAVADISLHAVNGKRILSGKAFASNGAFGMSRPSLAPGAYLLSVKGVDGGSFSARVVHGGGKFSVSAAFAGDTPPLLGKRTAAEDCGAWTVKFTAAGYHDSSITVNLTTGQQPLNLGAIVMRRNMDIGEIGPIGCSREGLINAANLYLKAVEAGDHTLMPLTSNARYVENDNQASMNRDRVVAFGEGLWTTPLKADFYRHFADVDSCASFSEVVYSTTPTHYINGVRVKVSGDKISEVFAVVTQAGDWLFNAPNYKRYSEAEDWGELPENQRLTRRELLDGAEAYFRYFSDKSVEAPWGIPCARLEGGAYTGNNANSTCNVGVPDLSMRISTIWHLADVNHGMVVLYVYFGGPDTHMFRIVKDHGYRYIHTLTAMKQSDFQGMPPGQ